jgi:hypothetical protein
MRRLLLVVTAALVMAAMVVAAAMPAFAVGGPNSPGNSGHLKSGPGGGGPGPGGDNVHHNDPGAGFQTKNPSTQQCTENLIKLNKPCVGAPSK